jgi:hypothetical protein
VGWIHRLLLENWETGLIISDPIPTGPFTSRFYGDHAAEEAACLVQSLLRHAVMDGMAHVPMTVGIMIP